MNMEMVVVLVVCGFLCCVVRRVWFGSLHFYSDAVLHVDVCSVCCYAKCSEAAYHFDARFVLIACRTGCLSSVSHVASVLYVRYFGMSVVLYGVDFVSVKFASADIMKMSADNIVSRSVM